LGRSFSICSLTLADNDKASDKDTALLIDVASLTDADTEALED